jgi:alpha-beta hydrolase superfamily lysophospholipase
MSGVLAADPPIEIYADDGLELYYRAFAPDGPARGALVYLHGIQSHGGWYVETAAELARRGYAVYLTDRRGSGESLALRGDFKDPAQLVADVRRFVRLARHEHPDTPVVLVGGCWGARPALAYALEYPYDLAGLALIGPALKAKVDLEPAEKRAVISGRLLEPERKIRIPLEPEMFTENPPYLEFIRNDPLSLHEVTARFYFEQSLWDRRLLANGELSMPVLLMQAGRDPIVDGEGVRLWFEQLQAPSKRFVRYPDFGHILDFEPERERYWDDLSAWLDEVVAQPPLVRRAGRRTATVAAVEVLAVELPFRFSFGHALASRSSSTNVVARVVLEDGTAGYGEGVPREYVTGETAETALEALTERQVPALLGLDPASPEELAAAIDQAAPPVGPDGHLQTAARCALELALLDAFGRRLGLSVQAWLGGEAARQVRYDVVLPFASPSKVAVLARVIKAFGVRQVKVKVGDDLDKELETLGILRHLARAGGRSPRRRELRLDRRGGACGDRAHARTRNQRGRAAGRRRRPRGARPAHGRGAGGDRRRRVAPDGRGRAEHRRGRGLQRVQHPGLQMRRPARLDGDRPDRTGGGPRHRRGRAGRRERPALGGGPAPGRGDRLTTVRRRLRRQPAPEGRPDRRARAAGLRRVGEDSRRPGARRPGQARRARASHDLDHDNREQEVT